MFLKGDKTFSINRCLPGKDKLRFHVVGKLSCFLWWGEDESTNSRHLAHVLCVLVLPSVTMGTRHELANRISAGSRHQWLTWSRLFRKREPSPTECFSPVCCPGVLWLADLKKNITQKVRNIVLISDIKNQACYNRREILIKFLQFSNEWADILVFITFSWEKSNFLILTCTVVSRLKSHFLLDHVQHCLEELLKCWGHDLKYWVI